MRVVQRIGRVDRAEYWIVGWDFEPRGELGFV